LSLNAGQTIDVIQEELAEALGLELVDPDKFVDQLEMSIDFHTFLVNSA
jgi:hypothetical protein